MAIFFVLGPTYWRTPRRGATPMDIRRRIARRLEEHGHLSVILEDLEDRGSDQDLVDTFYPANHWGRGPRQSRKLYDLQHAT